MKRNPLHLLAAIIIFVNLTTLSSTAYSAAILGWNDFGMHSIDSSYSVFSISPPYNTIEAQLIVNGKLVTNSSGYNLTYEAVADPSGSINKSSVGKSNWIDYSQALYRKYLAEIDPLRYLSDADEGLLFWKMPGPANIPQSMLFETQNFFNPDISTLVNWFRAEGIPLTPYDDDGKKNSYPMFRLTARDSTNAVIAQSDIVLPVSDEMDCRACHGANTQAAASPAGGWITDPIPGRESRLNILKLHDEKQFAGHPALYADALTAKGLDPLGLFPTATAGKPVLCAFCHASNALGYLSYSSSYGAVSQLTTSIHSKHSGVIDPQTNAPMDSASNRSACYRCHAESSSAKYLRGAMSTTVANDGTMKIQCQDCHGSMSQVGSSSRTGWFVEPKCQSCHTGTATSNKGQIRYDSVFEVNGQERTATDSTFATNADTPTPGLSLYRFSTGHGGLQCSACHGSTHAEFPSTQSNDNLRNILLQGHAGVMVECGSCHTTVPTSPNGGPHGMHPVGQSWILGHQSAVAQVGQADCQKCHGVDYRGTALSRAQDNRVLIAGGGQNFYRGATIGCYTCHQGPANYSMNASPAPSVGNISAWTQPGKSVTITLPAVAAGVVLRVLSPAQNGAIVFDDGVATYYPNNGFTGIDTFTFVGYDGTKNSPIATGTITVAESKPPVGQAPGVSVSPLSQAMIAGTSTTLSVAVTGTAPFTYQWYKNGLMIAQATDSSLPLPNVTNASAGVYLVHVSNSYGAINSARAVISVGSATAKNLPNISYFVPTTGKTGDKVTLVGSAFTGTTVVKFNNMSAVFTASSDQNITTNVPAGATSGVFTVTNQNGSKTSTQVFTVKPAPGIISINPASGPVGTKVTITGSNFIPGSRVYFNSVPAVQIGQTPGVLTATVPTKATTGGIEVVTDGGIAFAGTTFTVTAPPVITAFSPIYGKFGDTLTIYGSGFTGAKYVGINGKSTAFTVITDNKITTTIPAGATSGKITVSNTDGTFLGLRVLAVKPLPIVSSITSKSGPVGSTISIAGSNFIFPVKVKFNGTTAIQVLNGSTTLLNVTVPPMATSGPIVVTTEGGTATTTPSYTVTHPPVITSVLPLSGKIGSTITFIGSGFTSSSTFRFNGMLVSTFTVVSDKVVTAVVPPGTTSGKITVSNTEGIATSPRLFAVASITSR